MGLVDLWGILQAVSRSSPHLSVAHHFWASSPPQHVTLPLLAYRSVCCQILRLAEACQQGCGAGQVRMGGWGAYTIKRSIFAFDAPACELDCDHPLTAQPCATLTSFWALIIPCSYQPPSPAAMCTAVLDMAEPASQLALSVDQLALACVCQNSVSFFSISDLAAEGARGPNQPPPSIRPVRQLALDAAIKQFVWCKAAVGQGAGAQRYLLVTEDNVCQVQL